MRIVEIEGEFQRSYSEEKKYPAFLTNASVKKGFDMGLLESSLFEDLLKLKDLDIIISNQKENTKPKTDSDDLKDGAELLAALNEQKLIAVIYLGVLGANKNLNKSFDEFLELYHYELPETVEIYGKLIAGLVSNKSNNFAKELQQQAKENKKKHRKHKKHQQQKHQD